MSAVQLHTIQMDLEIREYRNADCEACRALWAQITERHRLIYGDPTIGGNDPGRGLDGYLANPGRRATWVAEADGTVIGMTGLIGTYDDEAEVEPVIVAEAFRSHGVGRALVAHAISSDQRNRTAER